MKYLKSIYINKKLQNELNNLEENQSPCRGLDNFSIIVDKGKLKKRKIKLVNHLAPLPRVIFRLSGYQIPRDNIQVSKHFSMPELHKERKSAKPRANSYVAIPRRKDYSFKSKYIVDLVSQHLTKSSHLFSYPSQIQFKIYRSQLSTAEESCCCSSNSDVMFEVIKSLYDGCGFKHREERRLRVLRKSLGTLAIEGTQSGKQRKEQVKKAEKILQNKRSAEKTRILREFIKAKQPLPESKTPSEKALIQKVRADLGLPPDPKTAAEKEGIRKAEVGEIKTPLEEKTLDGGTPSENKLIEKKGAKVATLIGISSGELRVARAKGLIIPLKGKTPEQKEKILKGLAMEGLPLPEGRTASEKKLIDKVRVYLGLPPELNTIAMKNKYARAASEELMQPLEGEIPKQKENILKGLHDLAFPFPKERTPPEKAPVAKVMFGARAVLEKLVQSEKMRQEKAAGVLTPLEGKSPQQKESILKGLELHSMLLPEGNFSSEKQFINNVRAGLGLPPEPIKVATRDKYAIAAGAGLFVPLEGKSLKEKEKLLRGLHDIGLPLPERRTPAEKALIAKIMAEPPPRYGKLSPSEKMIRVKAAGLLTPVGGKTPEQKERILKGLAMHDISLPEGKSPSHKKLIDKVRTELGLPPEPTFSDMKSKHAKAAEAGLLQPLERKTPAEKENILQNEGIPLPEGRRSLEKCPAEKEQILQGLHDLGIPLPEGSTASEKSLIAKVKAKPWKVPTGKQSMAQAAGPVTPLVRQIIKGLTMQGIFLPEGKTPSEKNLINKIRVAIGLPPESKIHSIGDKAAEAGFLQPLEDKASKEKENNLKELADMGITLLEDTTLSQKALVSKRKRKPVASITTEKIRKAKAAGLLTPLTGKTPEQKENLLKGLAHAGLPLPEGRTPSEKTLIQKIKNEFKIPDRSPSLKLRRAKAAGLLTPLEGKTPAQKEKILRGRAAAGLPLPTGISPSEADLVQRIKDDTGYVTPSPLEKPRTAKAGALINTVKGKTPSKKEQVHKKKFTARVPTSGSETTSVIEMIKKLKTEYSKTSSEKLKNAKTAGLLTSLQGKTPEQKIKMLIKLIKLRLPLPEPKTGSEKDLIGKVRKEFGLPPEPKTASLKEQYKKAQAAGILTPLENKILPEKEKLLRLHDAGILLPERRSPLETSIIKKIKSKPRTMVSEKSKTAKEAGSSTPFEGKTAAQKERVLKGLVNAGAPLPEGKSPSEKALITKVVAETKSKKKSHSVKIKSAKTAGFLTSLTGKISEQKEKNMRGLAEPGLPLPEAKRPSQVKLAAKNPQEPKSPVVMEKHAKAALEGLSPTEREHTVSVVEEPVKRPPEKLKKAKAADLLVGKTPSEKNNNKKIRSEAGLPPFPTPSERLGMIKKKEKKLSATTEKKIGKALAQGIAAKEFEDIIKVTTCNQGCGCDKRKITFKQSYVKIRATTPDIPAICPCPEECIASVKSGAFIDNKGIKMRIGTAVEVPSYTREDIHTTDAKIEKRNEINLKPDHIKKPGYTQTKTLFDHTYKKDEMRNKYGGQNNKTTGIDENITFTLNTRSSDETRHNVSTVDVPNIDTKNDLYFHSPSYEVWVGGPKRFVNTFNFCKSLSDLYKEPISKDYLIVGNSCRGSLHSILVVKSDTSLCFSSSSQSLDTISVMSYANSSVTSNSTHYFDYQLSNELFSNSSIETTDCSTTSHAYNVTGTVTSGSGSSTRNQNH